MSNFCFTLWSMPSPIECVQFDDLTAMRELAQAVYANAEPCFQVDGVDSYGALRAVFGVIKQAAPGRSGRYVRFNHVFTEVSSFGQSSGHVDQGFRGLAVHHNISHEVPVTMATANQPRYKKTPGGVDLEHVHNLREGETIPGRLTIFSEGNVLNPNRIFFPGLLPTVHYFDRSSTSGPSSWARYATADHWLTPIFLSLQKHRHPSVKREANWAIERAKEFQYTKS